MVRVPKIQVFGASLLLRFGSLARVCQALMMMLVVACVLGGMDCCWLSFSQLVSVIPRLSRIRIMSTCAFIFFS